MITIRPASLFQPAPPASSSVGRSDGSGSDGVGVGVVVPEVAGRANAEVSSPPIFTDLSFSCRPLDFSRILTVSSS